MFTEWLEAEGGSFTTNLGEEEKNVQHGKMTKAWYLIKQTANTPLVSRET